MKTCRGVAKTVYSEESRANRTLFLLILIPSPRAEIHKTRGGSGGRASGTERKKRKGQNEREDRVRAGEGVLSAQAQIRSRIHLTQASIFDRPEGASMSTLCNRGFGTDPGEPIDGHRYQQSP